MVSMAELVERGAYLVCLDAEWGEYAVVTAREQNPRAFRERVYAALRAGWRPPAERVVDRRWLGRPASVSAVSVAPASEPKDEVASWA